MKRCYLALRSSLMGLGVSLHFMTSGYCARSNSIVRSQNMQPQNFYTSYNFTLLCIHPTMWLYPSHHNDRCYELAVINLRNGPIKQLKIHLKPVLKGLPCFIFSELAIFLILDQTVPIFLHVIIFINSWYLFYTTVEGFRLILQQLTLPSDVPSVNT